MDELQDTKNDIVLCIFESIHSSNFALWQEPRVFVRQLDTNSDIQITARPPLSLKDDMAQSVDAARLGGTDLFMSSRNIHQFLDMFLFLSCRKTGAY